MNACCATGLENLSTRITVSRFLSGWPESMSRARPSLLVLSSTRERSQWLFLSSWRSVCRSRCVCTTKLLSSRPSAVCTAQAQLGSVSSMYMPSGPVTALSNCVRRIASSACGMLSPKKRRRFSRCDRYACSWRSASLSRRFRSWARSLASSLALVTALISSSVTWRRLKFCCRSLWMSSLVRVSFSISSCILLRLSPVLDLSRRCSCAIFSSLDLISTSLSLIRRSHSRASFASCRRSAWRSLSSASIWARSCLCGSCPRVRSITLAASSSMRAAAATTTSSFWRSFVSSGSTLLSRRSSCSALAAWSRSFSFTTAQYSSSLRSSICPRSSQICCNSRRRSLSASTSCFFTYSSLALRSVMLAVSLYVALIERICASSSSICVPLRKY
eukprot:Unigene11394_Nuclearia_a/m.34756 Unigene11394_Nuclearia_a/g.34756  ORF Unigene11394_Nuclearia_a/g.34756 Unigene11394_Nuclearia_a/m.34756 type:complete len:389 (+) Unigene11394_Nuclearia_a:1515-2681(+)